MRKIFFILVLLLSAYQSNAQILKGSVSYYPKGPFQMTHEESLARIEINGGFNYTLKGFLNFEKENINFAVGATDKSEEVYMRLNFENKNKRLNTVIEDYKYMYYHFTMLDSRKIKIYIDYYPGKLFGTSNGVFVVSSIEDKYMYFMKATMEEPEIIKMLERYR